VFVHYFSSLIYSLPEFGDVSYLREKIKEQEELHTSKFIVLSEHRNPLSKTRSLKLKVRKIYLGFYLSVLTYYVP
jgi:hypothetical protein